MTDKGAIRLSGYFSKGYSKDGRTLMDMVFNPTPEEIANREANKTDDIEPAFGFKPAHYVLKESKGFEALQFTGDNIAEMKAFIEPGNYHGRKVLKSHVDLALDYHEPRNGMADIGDYVVHDLDNDEWYAMEAEWFEANYVRTM